MEEFDYIYLLYIYIYIYIYIYFKTLENYFLKTHFTRNLEIIMERKKIEKKSGRKYKIGL